MTDVVIECEQHELDVQMNRRKDRLISATGDLFLHCRCIEDLLRLLKNYLADLFLARDVALILLYGDHMTRLTLGNNGEVEEVNAPRDVGLAGICLETRRAVHTTQIRRES